MQTVALGKEMEALTNCTYYLMHLIQFYYYFLLERCPWGCIFVKAAVTLAVGVMVTTGMFF